MQKSKQDDVDKLRQLNVVIGKAETEGNAEWLAKVIAPELAFRRANKEKSFDNREAFLAKVARSNDRETEVESIELYGDRAVVICIVTVKTKDGDTKYHNLRLFVRHDEDWKLLGWANEPHGEAK
jgi:Domain of unknown function (DUF4440)